MLLYMKWGSCTCMPLTSTLLTNSTPPFRKVWLRAWCLNCHTHSGCRDRTERHMSETLVIGGSIVELPKGTLCTPICCRSGLLKRLVWSQLWPKLLSLNGQKRCLYPPADELDPLCDSLREHCLVGFNIRAKQLVRGVQATVTLPELGRPCFILLYAMDKAQFTVWREAAEEQLARRCSGFPFLGDGRKSEGNSFR